jgi:Flp pilus assembly protein CpaB
MAEMVGAPPRAGAPRGTVIGAIVAIVSFLLLLAMIVLLARQPGAGAGPTTGRIGVVVAARSISARQVLDPASLQVKQMYQGDAPANAFGRIDQVKGMMATTNLDAGQPITPGLVAKPGDDVSQPDLPYLSLPQGYVATTVPSSEQQGVAGYIRAGDYISVVAVVPTSGGQNAGTNTRTVLTNLRVLRVGLAPAKTSGGSQPGQAASAPALSSLTVMVTECQAELLNWFLANSQVRYTLESYKDYQQPPSGADQSCPSVSSGQGVTRAEIARRYPGIFNP